MNFNGSMQQVDDCFLKISLLQLFTLPLPPAIYSFLQKTAVKAVLDV